MNDSEDADISQSKLSQPEYPLLMPKMERQRIL